MPEENNRNKILFLTLIGVIGFAGGLLLIAIVIIILATLGIVI